jgi:hypothetical protein
MGERRTRGRADLTPGGPSARRAGKRRFRRFPTLCFACATRTWVTTALNSPARIFSNMIPKKIHYCWLSKDPFPQQIEDCMSSWRSILPEYEIIRWDLEKFDSNSVEFVRQAVEKKKWAFASDYIRLNAIFSEGGFYFDTDVKVVRPLDSFLSNSLVFPMEYHPFIAQDMSVRKLLDRQYRPLSSETYVPGIGLQAAIFGGEPSHPFLKACMEYYEQRDFIQPNGTMLTDPIAPGIYAKIAERFGFRYEDTEQLLDHGVRIVSSRYFASTMKNISNDAFAIHCCAGSWREERRFGIARIMRALRKRLRMAAGPRDRRPARAP